MSTLEERKKKALEKENTSDVKYAVFSETNFEDTETWLTFISIPGNEKKLELLRSHIDAVDWFEAPDHTAMFALDTDGVSARTAKEMIYVNLNTRYFPNKFDGPIKKIDFSFKNHHSDEYRAIEIFEKIGGGHICDFLGVEDLEGCSLCGSDDESEYSDYLSDSHSRSAHSRSATPITPIASETKSSPHASSRSQRQSPQNARKRKKPRKRVLNVNDLPKSLRKGKFYNKSTNNKNE